MSTTLTTFFEFMRPWFLNHGLKIIFIVIGVWMLNAIGRFLINKTVRKIITLKHMKTPEAEKKREDTLIAVFSGTLRITVWIIAILMIASELGLNIGPLLAAAGVAGLAFGFGGQYLIRDIISGLFIIFENQYRVGDVVCIGTTCGLVEDISLRLTILRDLDGTVHYVPNGEVHTASNLSKNYSRVNLNIGVAYDSDIEKVITIVNRVGQTLADDPKWKKDIIKAPQFLRIDEFADSAIIIKILGDTQPIRQWDVMGELRKRLKVAFDREGIEIPFPQRVMHSK